MRFITDSAFSCPPQMSQSFWRKFRSNDVIAPAAFAAFMPSMINSPVVSESAAKMPPLWNQRTPWPKISFQLKSPGLSMRARLVAAVVEHHRRAHALAPVAINRRHVRAADAVVLEPLVKRFHAHRPHALGDQVADGIIHHGGGDAGVQAEAIGEVGGAVEFAAADVDVALGGLAERDDAGIETMDQGAEGQEVQRAFFGDVQTIFHSVFLMI